MLDEITHFVNWMRRRNPTAHTWRDYSCDLRHFVTTVGDRPPNQITFHDVDQFVTAQVAAKYKASTVNRRLAAIQSLYTFLADEDQSLVCPVLPRRHYLRQRKGLPRPVPEEDLHAFFDVIEGEHFGTAQCKRDLAMFLLMLRCGLRLAEVAGLQLRDLYLAESPPRLLVLGKNSKERTAYLSAQVVQALRAYLSARPTVASEFVFLSYQEDGLSTTAIHKRLMKYREAAGVHFTAHQLRHTFANDLVGHDVPVTTVQALLGHAWITTTQTYVAANNRQVQKDFYGAVGTMEGWG